MKIVVIANEVLKLELTGHGIGEDIEIIWQNDFQAIEGCEIYIDLLFDPSLLTSKKFPADSKLFTILNAVETELKNLPENIIRINGWPGFLAKEIIEASAPDHLKERTEKIFSFFGKKIEWLPDITGFISPRVISMIINEAYFALEENVSTKKEIDTAMKLGTNYPYGPFEWAEKIGLKKIVSLLELLSHTNSRYTTASLLKKEAADS
jgi:3-hydroxybutyryl-CoA dehydrogenase